MWTTAGLVGAAMFALPPRLDARASARRAGGRPRALAVLWGVVSLLLYLSSARRCRSAHPRDRHRHPDRWSPGRSGPPAAPPASSARCSSSPRSSSRTSSRRARVAARRPLRRCLRDAAALRPERDRRRLPRARAGLRGRARRRDGRHADPQAPPAARRGAPARDGRARPADRALQPPQLRRRARARGRRPDGVALILFDFDAFKAINDEHGHPVGDAVLRAVAEACDGVVRDGDSLARLGGDEFAVVAPGARSSGVARIVASLEDAIAAPTSRPASPPYARASRGRSGPTTASAARSCSTAPTSACSTASD